MKPTTTLNCSGCSGHPEDAIEGDDDEEDTVPPTLIELAKQVRDVYQRVAIVDPDLYGYSLLDLVADNIERASLADLKAAIIVAGIYPNATPRIQAQIASYR